MNGVSWEREFGQNSCFLWQYRSLGTTRAHYEGGWKAGKTFSAPSHPCIPGSSDDNVCIALIVIVWETVFFWNNHSEYFLSLSQHRIVVGSKRERCVKCGERGRRRGRKREGKFWNKGSRERFLLSPRDFQNSRAQIFPCLSNVFS